MSSPDLNPVAIRALAQAELNEERRRALIDAEKQRLRARRWWHRLIPFRITLTRRNP